MTAGLVVVVVRKWRRWLAMTRKKKRSGERERKERRMGNL
jgi:hypothetical protein